MCVGGKLFACGFGRHSGKGLFSRNGKSSAGDLFGVRLVHIGHDEIKVRVHKGEKDEIKAFAASRGLSLNEFITTAILEAMNRAGT